MSEVFRKLIEEVHNQVSADTKPTKLCLEHMKALESIKTCSDCKKD